MFGEKVFLFLQEWCSNQQQRHHPGICENTDPHTPPQTCWIKHFGMSPSKLCFNKLARGLWFVLKGLRTTWLESKVGRRASLEKMVRRGLSDFQTETREMKRNMPCESQETRKFQAQGTADAKSLKQGRIYYSQITERKKVWPEHNYLREARENRGLTDQGIRDLSKEQEL